MYTENDDKNGTLNLDEEATENSLPNSENVATPQSEAVEVQDVRLPNVMKSKNFLLLFLGTLVTNVGVTLYSFAVSYYILRITDNNATIQGTYLAVGGIVFLVMSPLGGVLADRWNKVKIIYMGDLIKGGVILLSVVLIFIANGLSDASASVTLQLVALFMVGIVNYVIASVFSPASNALIPQIVKPNQLQQANSYFTVLRALESIFGILLAGVLYSALSITTLFIIVGCCYIASGISETFIKCTHVRPKEPLTVKRVFSDFGEGLRYIKSQKAILSLLLLILFINFFITPYYGNAKPYFIATTVTTAYENGGYLFSSFMTPEMWGSATSVFSGVGSLLGGMILSAKVQSRRPGKKIKLYIVLMAVCMGILAVCYYVLIELGISLSAFLIAECLLMFFSGFIVVGVNVPISTLIQSKVPSDKLAKVSSIVSIGSMGLTPVASFLGGLVLSGISFNPEVAPVGWGVFPLLVICAVGFIAVAVIMTFNKSVDEL